MHFREYDDVVVVVESDKFSTCLQRIGGSWISDKRVDVERDKKPIEQMSGQNLVEIRDPQAQNVVQVMEMIQMLGHQILQTAHASMAAKKKCFIQNGSPNFSALVCFGKKKYFHKNVAF